MKYTKKMWARLNEQERSWLIGSYFRNCNKCARTGGYLPDGCSECLICGEPMIGSGTCLSCMKYAKELLKKLKIKK
jgi:hypothetical protein